jgi:hypothetical protein
VQRQMYEITFVGRAGATLWAEFEDCEVSVGPDTTTLRTELPDDAAITGGSFCESLTLASKRGYESSAVLPGAATTSYTRGTPLTRSRNSGRPSGSPHVGTGGARGQHPPAPLSGSSNDPKTEAQRSASTAK